jgi:hypothetical protein
MQKLESQEKSSQDSPNGVFNITLEGYRNVLKLGITLDHLYILDCLNRGISLDELRGDIEKIDLLILTLKRKICVTDSGNISSLGRELLASSLQGSFSLEKIQEKAEDAFERWWKVYPSTDIFTYKGKNFEGNRGLRQKKQDCKKEFYKILNEGEYTVEDLIRALEFEVLLKKEASVKEGDNKMRYMINTMTYLNQRLFENFIEVSKQNKTNFKTKDNNDI